LRECQPQPIGKPHSGVGKHTSTDPTPNADPAIDDPWYWEQRLDPATNRVMPRIFHGDIDMPPLVLPDTPEPEFDSKKWTKSGTREITLNTESAIWRALDIQGSTVYTHAVNLIREIRADYEPHELPADAETWARILEFNGECYSIRAVERALEAA